MGKSAIFTRAYVRLQTKGNFSVLRIAALFSIKRSLCARGTLMLAGLSFKRSTAKLAIELMKKGSHGKLNLPNKKNHENPTRILH
jgi:hypothetical protein